MYEFLAHVRSCVTDGCNCCNRLCRVRLLNVFVFHPVIDATPRRFKYTKVKSNDFGLTAEEILLADDKVKPPFTPHSCRAVPCRWSFFEHVATVNFLAFEMKAEFRFVFYE